MLTAIFGGTGWAVLTLVFGALVAEYLRLMWVLWT